MTLLTFENVSKFYGASPALQNVSLEIPAGKIVGLLGPNGSGKTTLIKLINGLLQPDGGRILINDMEQISSILWHMLWRISIYRRSTYLLTMLCTMLSLRLIYVRL